MGDPRGDPSGEPSGGSSSDGDSGGRLAICGNGSVVAGCGSRAPPCSGDSVAAIGDASGGAIGTIALAGIVGPVGGGPTADIDCERDP